MHTATIYFVLLVVATTATARTSEEDRPCLVGDSCRALQDQRHVFSTTNGVVACCPRDGDTILMINGNCSCSSGNGVNGVFNIVGGKLNDESVARLNKAMEEMDQETVRINQRIEHKVLENGRKLGEQMSKLNE